MRHFQNCSEKVVHKFLNSSLGGQQPGEEYFRDGLVGPLTGLLAGGGEVLTQVWPGEMVNIVGSEGHLVGLGQALAVGGQLAVGVAELGGGQAGRAGAHRQGPGLVLGQRGGGVERLSSAHHAHSLNIRIIIFFMLSPGGRPDAGPAIKGAI